MNKNKKIDESKRTNRAGQIISSKVEKPVKHKEPSKVTRKQKEPNKEPSKVEKPVKHKEPSKVISKQKEPSKEPSKYKKTSKSASRELIPDYERVYEKPHHRDDFNTQNKQVDQNNSPTNSFPKESPEFLIWEEPDAIRDFLGDSDPFSVLFILGNMNDRLVKNFLEKKKNDILISSSLEWTKHAYSILFSMSCYTKYLLSMTDISSWIPLQVVASEAATKAAAEAADKANFNTAWKAAQHATHIALLDLEGKINHDVEKIESGEGYTNLVYFFKDHMEFQDHTFLDEIFDSAKAETAIPENNIFKSIKKWDEFKDEHFSSLEAKQLLILKPWIQHLDLITEGIQFGDLRKLSAKKMV